MIRIPRRQDLRQVAKSLRDAVRAPTTHVPLEGQGFMLLREFAHTRGDRDHALLTRAARGRSCIYDVGSNVGIAALLMSREAAPGALVTAFEPSETACRIILQHIALNPSHVRFDVVNSLVGAHDGEAVAFYWQDHSAGASTVAGHLANATKGAVLLTKASIALDGYSNAHGHEPDFVKIDVEGAEMAVLHGMRNLLLTRRPTIVLELHTLPTLTLAEHAEQLVGFLTSMGYAAWYPRTGERIVDARITLADRGRAHLYLAPSEDNAPEWLRALGHETGL